MKKILTTCTALLSAAILLAQSGATFWHEREKTLNTTPAFLPKTYRALTLDLDAMRNHLRLAPMEFTAAAQSAPLTVTLPMPDGTMENFAVWESPIMEPALAEQFPMIKTFAGKSLANPSTTMRLDYTLEGFHAIVHTAGSTALIAPEGPQQPVYLSFWLKDVDLSTAEATQFKCMVEHSAQEAEDFTENFNVNTDRSAPPVDLYTYRLAVATTSEYSFDYGNTAATILSNVTTVINNVNSVFERDVAVRVVLIANTTQTFFIGPAGADPYTNGNTQNMIDQNPAELNTAYGVTGYDIGHVLGTQGGGLASTGGVCDGNILNGYPKARAASCKFGPYNGPLFYIIVGHEMGHQFNALHNFNKCDMMNESPETAYEPGSGSTIMCYNGNDVCGVNHIQPTSDDYFHNNAMQRITAFTRSGPGGSCEVVLAGGNTTPVSNILTVGGFFIPIETPFSLTGEATDAEDAGLTYCWEQYDLGPMSTLGTYTGTSPMFRSFQPVTTPTRYFPRLETILSNTPDPAELLPTTSRVLTFHFTVRDNHPNAGAYNIDEIVFQSTATAGPFVVTYPNGGETFDVGEYVEVTWDVANTNLAPVNSHLVNIHLSTDGGLTYPTLLLTQTANDGSAFVVLPNLPTTTARIRVEAADNIFFDISNQNFTIAPPLQPGFLFATSPPEGGLSCDELEVELETEALLGYTGDVQFSVTGLPAGVTETYTTNPVMAGQPTTLTINTSGATQTGDLLLDILATSAGQPDALRFFTLTIVDTDLSGITATSPDDGASGEETLPDFTWSALPNALTYDIQIATDPAFTNIVDSGTGLTNAQFTPGLTLNDDQVYYWRVRASNECGSGDFSDPFSFRTVSQTCLDLTSTQNNINIPGTGLPLIQSVINVAQAGTISDVNLTNVKATHNALGDVVLRLKGPDATSVVLLDTPPCNSGTLNNGFDDQSPFTVTNCPTAGQTYKPEGQLADFVGKNALGDWIFELEVVNSLGEGGTFNDWQLEICAGLQATNPTVIKNDTLGVPPNDSRLVYSDRLIVTDADNLPSELEFTIVKNTEHGTVSRNGVQLSVGSHFTMLDVYGSAVEYTNTNPAALYDYFTFNVNDGGGGFTGTPRFNIKIDPNAAPSDASSVVENDDVYLYPNPANDEVTVVVGPMSGTPESVQVLDVQGRQMPSRMVGQVANHHRLNIAGVPSGLYFVQVKTTTGTFVKKLVVE
ncbi:MAG: T9SS type A sorting domain-containing protein [Bacteroidetes bacterium]|nr:T9SS type A sorting domain-containing protein [Bacteroidota bacterium]